MVVREGKRGNLYRDVIELVVLFNFMEFFYKKLLKLFRFRIVWSGLNMVV